MDIFYKPGDFALVQMIYNYGTRHEQKKHFVAKFTSVVRNKKQFTFLRMKSLLTDDGTRSIYFVFPAIEDKWLLSDDQIIKKLNATVVRGKYYFNEDLNEYENLS